MHTEWFNHAALTRPSEGGLSRRSFIKAGAIGSSGLVIGFFMPGANKFAHAADAKPVYTPNAFLRIAPDNTITVIVNRLESGQGAHTALPMLIAEELGADWSQMRGELAPVGDIFKDPVAGIQITGGSGTVAHSFTQYREIGARARSMLIGAAAEQWKVTPGQCSTAKGFVTGPAGQKASFGSLADAAMKQPIPAVVKLKDAKDFDYIGKRVKRLDARAKSNGKQEFGIDFTLPNTKVAVVARPPVSGAKVARFDAAKARAIKGVVDVVEVPVERGGRGIAVIADGYWPAKMGRDALVVEWDSSAVEKVTTARQMAEYAALSRTAGTVARKADMAALAGAPKKISATYEIPYLAHAPMEPLNFVVELKDGSCAVWVASQMPGFDQMAAAAAAGLKPEQVTITTMSAGGSFGRRANPTADNLVEAIHVAKAWKAAGKSGPLKVIWSREDDIKGGYYRPSHVHRAEIGLDENGNVLAWDHTIVGQSIMTGTPFENWGLKDGVDGSMTEGMGAPYEVPFKLSVHHPKANVSVLWWRSVGSSHTAFVMETLIDEAAHLAGIEPVAYRKKLMAGKHPRHVAALDLAVAKSGYGKRKLPKGRAYGVAVHEAFGTVVAYVVEASIVKGVPKLHKVTAGVHCNLAVNPLAIEAQIEGAVLMALGTTMKGGAITLKDGVVEQKNFNDFIVPRIADMPKVDVFTVPSNDPPSGLGEPGIPPLAPAFANALFALTGKRQRKMPFDLA